MAVLVKRSRKDIDMNRKPKTKITKKYVASDGLEILDIIILTDRSFSKYQKYSKKTAKSANYGEKKHSK